MVLNLANSTICILSKLDIMIKIPDTFEKIVKSVVDAAECKESAVSVAIRP